MPSTYHPENAHCGFLQVGPFWGADQHLELTGSTEVRQYISTQHDLNSQALTIHFAFPRSSKRSCITTENHHSASGTVGSEIRRSPVDIVNNPSLNHLEGFQTC